MNRSIARSIARMVLRKSTDHVGGGARGTIVGTHLLGNGDTSGIDNFLTGSFALSAQVCGVAFFIRSATTPNLPSSITDSRGINWTQVPGATATGSVFRITAYYVVTGVVAPGEGTMQFNHTAGDTPTGAAWSISEFTGVRLSDPIVAGNVVAGSQAANTSATIALPNLFENPKNANVYGVLHGANEDVAVQSGGGFTRLGQGGYATPASHVMTAYKVGGDRSDIPTWTTSAVARWTGFELRAA